MQIGAFELQEPLPKLTNPHLFVSLGPWIDVGSVGTLTLGTLEKQFNALELGRLSKPGAFYDFTRYRPTIHWVEGNRRIDVPSSVLRYAQSVEDHDLVFLHALEPHNRGEDLVDSVIQVAKHLGVQRYFQLGSMYGPVPHTRPFKAAGSASKEPVQEYLERAGVHRSTYEGPTSIMVLATEQARELGIETVSMIIQLPSYTRLEEDYKGHETLLSLLAGLYGFKIGLDAIAQKRERQYQELDQAIRADPRVLAVVRHLERIYDSEGAAEADDGEDVSLPPEVERFLQDLEKGQGHS